MSRSTAWTRLNSAEAQQMIRELKAEMRAEFYDWPLRVWAVGDMVLDSIVDDLDNDLDPAVVVRLAGTVLPELRHLLADAHQWHEPKPSSGDSRAKLRAKFQQMEGHAIAVIEAQNANDDLKRLLGIPVEDAQPPQT